MMGDIRSLEVARLINRVAEQNHVTPAEVRRDMQAAIDEAFNNPRKTEETAFHQSRIQRKGDIPDVDEYMYFLLAEMNPDHAHYPSESRPNRATRRRKKKKGYVD